MVKYIIIKLTEFNILKEKLTDNDILFASLRYGIIYKCKECKRKRFKLRDILYHISTEHNTWIKRNIKKPNPFYIYDSLISIPINISKLFL